MNKFYKPEADKNVAPTNVTIKIPFISEKILQIVDLIPRKGKYANASHFHFSEIMPESMVQYGDFLATSPCPYAYSEGPQFLRRGYITHPAIVAPVTGCVTKIE